MKLWHKLAIGGGIALAGFGALAYNKFVKTKRTLDMLTYFPKISKLNANLKRIKFDLKIAITNQSVDDLSLSTGGLVKLNKVIIYNLQGAVISVLKVNDLYKVYVPSGATSETPTIQVELPIATVLMLLKNFDITKITNVDYVINFLMGNLQYGFDIKTFYGENYTFTTLEN